MSAVDWFTRVVEKQGDEARAMTYGKRAYAYGQLGKLREAYKDADKVIELRPDWHSGYTTLGSLLSREGRYAEALDQMMIAKSKCQDPVQTQKIGLSE